MININLNGGLGPGGPSLVDDENRKNHFPFSKMALFYLLYTVRGFLDDERGWNNDRTHLGDVNYWMALIILLSM